MNQTLISTEFYSPQLSAVKQAATRIAEVVVRTPLLSSLTYSRKYNAKVQLKREDLQQVRSYKIRGAFNRIASLPREQMEKGVICASAGNHAQGVAFACNHLQVKAIIYMPVTTPRQKVEQTKMFGGEWTQVILKGDSFDDSQQQAVQHGEAEDLVFIHPFDDEKVIEGQATIALEILEQANEPIDYVFAPLGGGGLLAGLSSAAPAVTVTSGAADPAQESQALPPPSSTTTCADFGNAPSTRAPSSAMARAGSRPLPRMPGATSTSSSGSQCDSRLRYSAKPSATHAGARSPTATSRAFIAAGSGSRPGPRGW